MAKKKGSSLLETRKYNRRCIKEAIYWMEPVTRAAVAECLGLTLPTITTSVNEMMAEGILQEIPLPEECLTNNVGRKPVGIGFMPDVCTTIGVAIEPYATRIVLANLEGDILCQAEYEPGGSDYAKMVEQVSAQIREFLQTFEPKNLLGISVGVPGFVVRETGYIRQGQSKDWSNRNLAGDLSARLGVRVQVDNNVRVRAMGYESRHRKTRPDNFIYFFISRGFGCPQMVRDDIFSNYMFGGGEISYMILNVEEKDRMQQQFLGMLAGENVIVRKCRALIEEGKAPILEQISKKEGKLAIRQIVAAQEAGEESVCALMQEMVEYMAIALANVINLMRPEMVIVDGYLMGNAENAGQLERSTRKKLFALQEKDVRMVFAEYDGFDTAKGAAYAGMRTWFLEE